MLPSLSSAFDLSSGSSRAIRAFRHPERYGRQANDPTLGPGGGRTAAVGLTRAILDTFPIIKFGASNDETVNVNADAHSRGKDLETGEADQDTTGTGEGFEMVERHSIHSEGDGGAGGVLELEELGVVGTSNGESPDRRGRASLGSHSRSQTQTTSMRQLSGSCRQNVLSGVNTNTTVAEPEAMTSNFGSVSPSPVDPTTIGHETCPICILDFELGDDLRVLPCEGKHRFHQSCVDQWLLEMSSSCPLCREGWYSFLSMIYTF